MASASGLSAAHRAKARSVVMDGVELMLDNKRDVHYTMGPARWQGIDRRLDPRKGQFPAYSDCSSSSTWLLWAGLHLPFDVRDLVNGADWLAGYTGTILRHGKTVRHRENIKVADLLVYGRPGSTGEHVVLSVGGERAFSHGSEPGPYLVDIDYRLDLMAIKRFI